jgi:acyl-CoA hydrolase
MKLDMTEVNHEQEIRFCRQTKVIQTHHVFPFDSNYHGTLFGGKLMSMIDDCAAISGERFGRTTNVTASVDTLNFIKPLPTGHSVCIDTFVSGAGKTSMEIFTKVTGENLRTGERYLAATCFLTFVALPDENGQKVSLPKIVPETVEEKFINSGYEERRQKRRTDLDYQKQLHEHLTIEIPWAD